MDLYFKIQNENIFKWNKIQIVNADTQHGTDGGR